jgi:hypothetical protein
VAVASLVLAAAGCAPKYGSDTTDPAGQIGAIRVAAAQNDRSAIPRLIEFLESDDAAVRLFSIGTLEQLTGERFGYDPAAPPSRRREAARRWAGWYAGAAATPGARSAEPAAGPLHSDIAGDDPPSRPAGRSPGLHPRHEQGP